MQVSFIIPLYNGLALTRECLRTLQATLSADLPHEIVLVDDGSTDGTREWLTTLGHPCRVLLNEKNLGFAGACNRGAAASSGDYLFFLNNDLILLPGWLEPMLGVLTQNSNAAFVGNVQVNAATGAIDHAGIRFNHKGKPEHIASLPLSASLLRTRRVVALTGACFALRRSVWLELGAFDEGFRNGGEDVDLCLRALATGRQNYVALRSIVRHHISQSPGRKTHDEFNSFRLTRRWEAAIMQYSVRAWCRHYLETEWHGARDPEDYATGILILLYHWHLLPSPPSAALAGTRRALEAELKRWRELFPIALPRAFQMKL